MAKYQVTPIKIVDTTPKNYPGIELFAPYENVGIISRKNSGKSNLIAFILEHVVNRSIDVTIICPTAQRDPVWQAITDRLIRNGIQYQIFDDISVIPSLIENWRQKPEDSNVNSYFNIPKDDIKTEHILIIDDVGSAMRGKVLPILRINRHLHCKIILSGQARTDLSPGEYANLDRIIILGGMPNDRITEIYDALSLPMNIKDFISIYRRATHVKYDFLNINLRTNVFQNNFDDILYSDEAR